MHERLQNILAKRGVASRRQAAHMIEQGLVSVNGTTVYQPGLRVTATDQICLKGQPLATAPEMLRTVLLYKPSGLICSASSRQGPTVCDLLRPHFTERLVPIGRLDKESEGLLLMSNDGELHQLLSHPRYGHSKKYIATISGRLTPQKLAILRSPLQIDGYTIRPVQVEPLPTPRNLPQRLAFTLLEGRNRQIRKMCAHAELKIIQLKRVSIAHLQIGSMRPGDWYELKPQDIGKLKNAHHRASQ